MAGDILMLFLFNNDIAATLAIQAATVTAVAILFLAPGASGPRLG